MASVEDGGEVAADVLGRAGGEPWGLIGSGEPRIGEDPQSAFLLPWQQ